MAYSARGRGNDENTGKLYRKWDGYEVEQHQHICSFDNTTITCKEGLSFEDPCALLEDYTWHKKREMERIHLVRGEDKGRRAWYYLLVKNDEMVERFHAERKRDEFINLGHYGQILKSGYGENPPEEARAAIYEMYSVLQ